MKSLGKIEKAVTHIARNLNTQRDTEGPPLNNDEIQALLGNRRTNSTQDGEGN